MTSTMAALDSAWFQRAADYQATLTMPTGALGRILELGRQLCAIQETLSPVAEPAAVVVMAADHGIAAEGVSAYPQEVTGQMTANFLRGGAAINVLARQMGAQVIVVDMGLKQPPAVRPATEEIGWLPQLSVARGTANFVREPAMTLPQLEQALAAGRSVVRDYLVPRGVRVAALGEMGIGNTTSASALTAALTGLPAAAVTGRGTGIDDAIWQHKIRVIEQALERHFPGRSGPVAVRDALQKVGGFEIAGLVGAALEAAARRMLVVLDGFISTVAGFVAVQLEPLLRSYLVAAHQSVERGQRVLLERLELQPLLDLGLRLGEGSGAALALPLVQSAAAILREMATFESAAVSERMGR